MAAGSNIVDLTMRATVYSPPSEEFPHIAIVFHTDGAILLARPFSDAEDAHKYIVDVSGSLVAISANHGESTQHQAQVDAAGNSAPAIE